MPNIHSRYLQKRLPYKIPLQYASATQPGLYPPQVMDIENWCKANVGEPALRKFVNTSRSAKLGETAHRNPNGTWAIYKGMLYFKYSKDAVRIKLLGLVDISQKSTTMAFNVVPRYNFNVRIVG